MVLRLNNFDYSLPDLARQLGYRPMGYTEKGELNCVRPLGGNYPRFHIYMTATPEAVNMNLHLDQKKPSYAGATAHSGDYDSETVRNEAERIKELVFRLH